MLKFACISCSPVQHAGDVLSEVHLGIVLGFVTDHPPGVGYAPESAGVVGDAVEDVEWNPIFVFYLRRLNRPAEELLHVALADVAGQLTNVALGRSFHKQLGVYLARDYYSDLYNLQLAS